MKNVKIGSVIKAYDFPENVKCYMIGRVNKLVGDSYECQMIAEVFNNEVRSDSSPVFWTPVRGTHFLDKIWNRIEILA